MSIAEFPVATGESAPDRVPPQDRAAEKSVLGAMMLSKDAIAEVVETLRAEEFYVPAHQTLYGVIHEMFSRNEPADIVTVADRLSRSGDLARIGGPSYLHTLVGEVATATNAAHYAKIVHDKAVLRNLATAGTRIAQWSYAGEGEVEQIADRAQAEIFDATTSRITQDYQPLSSIMEGAITEIEGIAARGGQMVGVPTGFIDLDRLTNGLHPGQLIIVAARPAIGKALAMDTPVPTPDGWTTMGELSVGQHVFGDDGAPTRVVAATELMLSRPCHMVEFSDGSSVVADDNHRWRVDVDGRPRIRTTAELHRRLLARPDGPVVLPEVAPLRLPQRKLPIDPYALGVWLASADASPIPEVEMLVEGRAHSLQRVGQSASRLNIARSGPIPAEYLRAAVEQRQALLAGLLDAGADVEPDGSIVFATESRPLAQGVHELLGTLGIAADISGHPSRRFAGTSRTQVRCATAAQVFRVADKQLRHKEQSAPEAAERRRIVAVTPIPSVPVRCIEVDNASRLFLAGRSMVPTHNSTLGLDVARSASVKHGLASVIFSLEMSRNEIVTRLLSAEAQIPLHHMRSGNMHDPEWRKIAARQGALHEAPLFVDDSPNMTMAEIRAKCRRLRQRHELRLVVVDYLQLMTSGKKVESRQQEVSEFSRSLKLLAKELDVPVIAISQLNRGPEARNDKKPMLSDLRESGSLEQDADMVVLIHREDAYDRDSPRIGEADLIVAKHRNGPTDTVTVAFQGHYSRFVDMAPE